MKDQKTTLQLQSELNELLLWFESDSIDIDEAVKKYQQGVQLIQLLQTRLKTAENTIKKIAKA